MKQTTLTNGELYVTGEFGDTFKVELGEVKADMMLNVVLSPTKETAENGVEAVSFTVDILNETVTAVILEEGYRIKR